MKVASLVVLILALATSAFAGKPNSGGCSGESPLSWSFVDIGGAFHSDGQGSYTHNVGGVTNSLIQDVTKDATIFIPGPGRKGTGRAISVQVPEAISGSTIYGGPVPFAGEPSFLTTGQFNIENIRAFDDNGNPMFPAGSNAVFYTRAQGRFTGPDGKIYRWAQYPAAGSCPGDLPCVPDRLLFGLEPNDPYETVWVKVTYTAATSTNADYWLVEPVVDPQTTTVWQLSKSGGQATHMGQYSMPFSVIITALCPLQ